MSLEGFLHINGRDPMYVYEESIWLCHWELTWSGARAQQRHKLGRSGNYSDKAWEYVHSENILKIKSVYFTHKFEAWDKESIKITIRFYHEYLERIIVGAKG
jgi:hypothetical protein